MNWTELLLGQIPEALYFALFIIFTKKVTSHRLVFFVVILIEYLLLVNLFPFNWCFHIGLTIMVYLSLKVIYKERAQITDIFTFGISSVLLIIVSIVNYLIFCKLLNVNFVVSAVTQKLILFALLLCLKPKLHNIQKLYKRLWNRNDKLPKKMKTTTFRAINVVVFNATFYIINVCMLIAIIHNRGGA
jgi:hypothetical protein